MANPTSDHQARGNNQKGARPRLSGHHHVDEPPKQKCPLPCSNKMFPGDAAWGMLTDPSAIHSKQAYPAWSARSMAVQRESEGRSPDHQPLLQRIFDPCKLLHGSQEAPDSQGSWQPRQRAEAQDGWRTREPHSKLVVLMRWPGRGSACLCQGE